jgi:hypothetical protein
MALWPDQGRRGVDNHWIARKFAIRVFDEVRTANRGKDATSLKTTYITTTLVTILCYHDLSVRDNINTTKPFTKE